MSPQSMVFRCGSVKCGSTLAVAGGSCAPKISPRRGPNIQGSEDIPTENKTKNKWICPIIWGRSAISQTQKMFKKYFSMSVEGAYPKMVSPRRGGGQAGQLDFPTHQPLKGIL